MMRNRMLAGLAALGLAIWLQGALSGQEKRGRAERRSDRERATDRAEVGGTALTAKAFVHRASRAGMEEVKFAKMALERGSSPAVRKFAEHMAHDHGQANKELMALAESKGFAPARGMDRKHQALADKLGNLEGSKFDHAFMRGQVKDHEDAVALFSDYARNGDDPQLKAFAAKTLPTLKEHLRMAREIAGKERSGVGAGTGSGRERIRQE